MECTRVPAGRNLGRSYRAPWLFVSRETGQSWYFGWRDRAFSYDNLGRQVQGWPMFVLRTSLCKRVVGSACPRMTCWSDGA